LGTATATSLSATTSMTLGGSAVLTSSNIGGSVPGITGSGASGTWGISISGTAATATLALTATLATTASALTNFTAGYSSSVLNLTTPGTLDAVGYVTGFNGTALTSGVTDGGLYQSAYSTSWYHQIYGDFRSGQIALRGMNSGTWQSWRYVLDSSNYTSYVTQLSGNAFTNGSDGWFRSNGNAGWYSNTYSTGIYSTSTGLVQTYNSSSMQVNGALYATSSITAYYSDERLKTKVGKIENALDKVDQLSGFLYVENDLAKSLGFKNEQQQVALSAQAVQRIQPEAVALAPFDRETDGTSKSGENYLTVQYERLVPLLVEAIKELRAEVNTIKAQLKG
jgi:hypothetical protein